jgi:hypothetical protein
MALRALVTDIESVDEPLRELYVEKEGKYVLAVEAVDGYDLQDITGLSRALHSERTRAAQFEDRVKIYEGIDPDAARDALARVESFGDLDPAKARETMSAYERLAQLDPEKEAEKIAEIKFKASKEQLVGQFNRRESELVGSLTETKSILERREKQIEKLVKENAIKTELAKRNPLPEAADVLERLISDSVRLREVNGQYVTEVVDEQGIPRINHTGAAVTVADYVAELRDRKAALFQPDQTRGADLTPPSQTSVKTDSNPWIQGPAYSMTQQMYLMKTDPAKASALMAQAGL